MNNKTKELEDEINKRKKKVRRKLGNPLPEEFDDKDDEYPEAYWDGSIELLVKELKGRKDARKEILQFIEEQRDKGNMVGGGFSAGLCLSDLLKMLEKEE